MDDSAKMLGALGVSPESLGGTRVEELDTDDYRVWGRPVIRIGPYHGDTSTPAKSIAGYDELVLLRVADPLGDLQEATAFIEEKGGRITSVQAFAHGGQEGAAVIWACPQEDRSVTYRGVLTVSSRFHLQLICPEYGDFHPSFPDDVRPMTGNRFAILAMRFRQEERRKRGGRLPPPLSRAQHSELVRRTEEECWDSEFPTHPLSRLRAYLAQFRTGLARESN